VEKINIVIDTKLRKEADRVAKREKVSRSALFRRAIQEFALREQAKEKGRPSAPSRSRL
jgi:metal-responsive CopG/Arc/MetJ family transcriptional regulator